MKNLTDFRKTLEAGVDLRLMQGSFAWPMNNLLNGFTDQSLAVSFITELWLLQNDGMDPRFTMLQPC